MQPGKILMKNSSKRLKTLCNPPNHSWQLITKSIIAKIILLKSCSLSTVTYLVNPSPWLWMWHLLTWKAPLPIILQRVKTSVPHTLPILPYMSVNLSYRNLLAPSRINIKTFFVHRRIFCGFVPYPLKRSCRAKTFVKQFSAKLCIISVKEKTTWLLEWYCIECIEFF